MAMLMSNLAQQILAVQTRVLLGIMRMSETMLDRALSHYPPNDNGEGRGERRARAREWEQESRRGRREVGGRREERREEGGRRREEEAIVSWREARRIARRLENK